jgi:hypothetical protein
MAKIPLDLGSTPDEVKRVPPGIYDFEILSATVESNRAGDGQVLNVQGQIVNNEEYETMRLGERIACKGQFGPVKQRRLVKCCGIEPSKDTEADDLVGNVVRVVVKDRSWEDEVSGETRVTPTIAEYLVSD